MTTTTMMERASKVDDMGQLVEFLPCLAVPRNSYNDDNNDSEDRRMLATSPALDRATHCEEVGE